MTAPTFTEDDVEACAKKACSDAGGKWDAQHFTETLDGQLPEEQREYFRDITRAVLTEMVRRGRRKG